MADRNLVVVRAGDKSLHEGWLAPGRSWDLVVSYFGDDPDRWRQPGVRRIDHKGSKWVGLHTLLTSGQIDWRAYDRIWLPDDDLACTPQAVEHLFAHAHLHELTLSQPSLSKDSYISHASTAHNPRFVVRRTNFVEAMAPLFTRAFLERVLPTFVENESGWGIDYLWQMYLDKPRLDCGVIDAVQVRHTRPVGGPNYARMKAEGRSPFDEFRALRSKYALTDITHLCWGGLSADGHELRTDEPQETMRLLGMALDGMRPWLDEAGISAVIAGQIAASPALREAAQRSIATAAA
jgi:hypothetical protein